MSNADIHVRPFKEADTDDWVRFVERCPQAHFFHRIEWRHILQTVYGHRPHYLVAERAGQWCGVLPLAEIKGPWLPFKGRVFGHALTSLPFAVYGGAAADDAATVLALNEAAAQLGRELGVDHLELRHQQRYQPDWPCQDLYYTFRKTLHPDHEQNLLAIPRKQRAMVRKGAGFGLSTVVEHDARRFFHLYADNMQRHGTPPMPLRYFQTLLDTFGSDGDVLLVLNAQGTPVSGVLSFYFRGEAMPYYAGDLSEARALAANDFKYAELMRHAAQRGCTRFDFGRSKRDTGAFDFKKNWGFEAQPLYYEYQLFQREDIPQHNPNNPKYQHAIRLWRQLPRSVVNALGPHIVRYLG